MTARPRFTQVIQMKTSKIDEFLQLRREYDADRASAEVMGFLGARVLASRENPGDYLIIADFAEVDGTLTAEQEARRNDARNEAEGWYARLMALVDGQPEFDDYDELYRTGITGNIRTG